MNPAHPMQPRTAPPSIFRSWPLVAALPALLLACGGDEAPGDGPSDAAKTPTATGTPAGDEGPRSRVVFEPLGDRKSVV